MTAADEYKALADSYRRGDPFDDATRARLHALAVEHGNYYMARLTEPVEIVDTTGFSDGML